MVLARTRTAAQRPHAFLPLVEKSQFITTPMPDASEYRERPGQPDAEAVEHRPVERVANQSGVQYIPPVTKVKGEFTQRVARIQVNVVELLVGGGEQVALPAHGAIDDPAVPVQISAQACDRGRSVQQRGGSQERDWQIHQIHTRVELVGED